TGNDTLEVISVRSLSPTELAWWEPSSYPPDSLWEKHVVSTVGDHCRLFPCDLDQDGDMDILIARDHSDGLHWCENLDGSGTSWVKHQIGGYYDRASSVRAADIDGDGDVDVVISNNQDGELVWFENLNGSATSWERHLIEAGLQNPGRVHAADVTGDGYTDVILRQFLYRNMDGTGQQWVRFQYASGLNPEVADFNQDGEPDILNIQSTGISWHDLEGHTEGWLLSSIRDMTSYPQWDSITWTGEEPPGTDIFFQLRSSNDWEDMGAWSDTIFAPRNLAGVLDSTHRYLQYRVGMTSETEFQSPILDEVGFYWTFLGIEGGEGTEEFSISAFPNPSAGSVSILVPPVFLEEAEMSVYDISGRFVRKLSETDGNVFAWDCRDPSGNEIPPGLYIVRGTAGGRSHSVRFVKI
ncbi:MAG: T9SS type A sorting domain-containing protein, partial [Candidatus Aegiribacteria sp.]